MLDQHLPRVPDRGEVEDRVPLDHQIEVGEQLVPAGLVKIEPKGDRPLMKEVFERCLRIRQGPLVHEFKLHLEQHRPAGVSGG